MSEENGAANEYAPVAQLDPEQPSSKGRRAGSNPARCMNRTGSSKAEPPPFKRMDAGSSPARCSEEKNGSVAQLAEAPDSESG